MEEIESHPWLQGVDPSPATKYNIPLVSYKNLSEEEHNSIIQRMVLGDIADRDAIVEYVLVTLGAGLRVCFLWPADTHGLTLLTAGTVLVRRYGGRTRRSAGHSASAIRKLGVRKK